MIQWSGPHTILFILPALSMEVQTLQEENLSDKKSVESARRLRLIEKRHNIQGVSQNAQPKIRNSSENDDI